MSYPVQLVVAPPRQYERIQVVLRLMIAIALGWIGITAGRLLFLLYLVLPVLAAISLLTRGAGWYQAQAAPRLWRVISWLLAFDAYMLLVTDRFPVELDGDVHVTMQIVARPSTQSALLRLLTSIPSALALLLLGILSGLFALCALITILIDRSVPAWILSFQEGFLRWQARLDAYHASLVDEYPPFSFVHDEHPASAASAHPL